MTPAAALDTFVHRWEPGASPDAPTLLLLHGTGGDERDLLPLGEALVPGAHRLSPRGRVLEQGMPRFFRRLAPGVFDLDDLRLQTAALGAFTDAAVEAHALDRARLVAVGFSNGANIAASLLLARPGTLGGAVLLRPMVPFVPDPLPDLAGVPVLLLAGRFDQMCPPAESERLADLLTRAGADVTLRWQNAGHGLLHDDVEVAKEWLGGRLK